MGRLIDVNPPRGTCADPGDNADERRRRIDASPLFRALLVVDDHGMRRSTIAVVQAVLITVALALNRTRLPPLTSITLTRGIPCRRRSRGRGGAVPGHTVDLRFSVVNPSGESVRFTSVATGRVLSSDEAACPAANITVRRHADLALHVPSEATIPASLPDADHVGDGPGRFRAATFTIGLHGARVPAHPGRAPLGRGRRG